MEQQKEESDKSIAEQFAQTNAEVDKQMEQDLRNAEREINRELNGLLQPVDDSAIREKAKATPQSQLTLKQRPGSTRSVSSSR